MPNYRATSEGNIQFTDEEEIAWAAQQAVRAADAEVYKASEVRSERNAKLASTDWTQIADSTADKAAWATYRQALRDITAQAGFPQTITWPDAP